MICLTASRPCTLGVCTTPGYSCPTPPTADRRDARLRHWLLVPDATSEVQVRGHRVPWAHAHGSPGCIPGSRVPSSAQPDQERRKEMTGSSDSYTRNVALEKALQYHDGMALTSDDVVATAEKFRAFLAGDKPQSLIGDTVKASLEQFGKAVRAQADRPRFDDGYVYYQFAGRDTLCLVPKSSRPTSDVEPQRLALDDFSPHPRLTWGRPGPGNPKSRNTLYQSLSYHRIGTAQAMAVYDKYVK